ncbi:MAG: hypothetical protein AABY22_31535, partial [Nanoarchaeota archaeon]
MNREELQLKIANTIVENKKCIIHASPRSGKSKSCLDALKQISGTVLISVPSEFMIEIWKEEAVKWYYPEEREYFFHKVDFCCHASLHKQKHYDVLILDECHSVISDIRIEGIKQIKANRIIGLSGSLSKKSREILKEQLELEVKLEYSVDSAVANNVIKDYQIYVHQVALLPEEQREYDKLTRVVAWAKEKGGKTLMFASLKRGRFLYNLKSKNKYAEKLIKDFDRYLLFAQLKVVVNQLCSNVYYGGINEQVVADFQDGSINSLGIVKLLNEGFTAVNLDTAVIVAVNSSEISAIQRILRVLTKEEESKIANVHIIVSKNTV